MKKPKLIIFDLDGTLSDNPDFEEDVYSRSLDKIVAEKRGNYGTEVLNQCRKTFEGKGELSLFALNIPFAGWAKIINESSVDLVRPDHELVEQIKKIDAQKVIYTGSPTIIAGRIIEKIGFSVNDFDLILGYSEPEIFPVKWTSSPVVLEKIINQFGCDPDEAWMVGNEWTIDSMPAKSIGMKTAQIKTKIGDPDFYFDTIKEFLKFFAGLF